ncbi:MAG: bacillithiol biosynthesis cysteine-adding enzyme BshC [Chlorobi bacterium]|nr:bacillithiol biosynthesis cysteine-adding enzyme BshC [Chlorobiota bacterium]
MITLPFSILPGTTPLFLDYVRRYSDATRFYPGHYSDLSSYESQLASLDERLFLREDLVNILHKQNEHFQSPSSVHESIDKLLDANACAVVTGQQVGLFGGPLYTVYKALTTVQLCHWLKDQFPDREFVPVFWLESEDHDFAEANHASFIDKDNTYFTLAYHQDLVEEGLNTGPVGAMRFDDSIGNLVHELFGHCSLTDFSQDLRDLLESTYKPGTTFVEAFTRYYNRLFGKHGLVFFDSNNPAAKRLLLPAIMQELDTFPVAGEEVIKRSTELEIQYHAQLKPRAINLFLFHKQGRYAIEPSGRRFWLRGTRKHFEREELFELARTEPERFSPNVLLRPIFQDFLFPTVAYVAGPAEIAYFAQLEPVYRHFQIPMPVIFPRASITLIEAKIQKLFDKYDLPYAAAFEGGDDLYTRLADHGSEAESHEILQQLKSDLESVASGIESWIPRLPTNTHDAAVTTATKLRNIFAIFENRVTKELQQRDSVMQSQISKLLTYLLPEGIPQERSFNLATFLNRYGESITDTIFEACVPFPAEHRLVNLRTDLR